MHHAEALRADGETQHQNFSLQYDLLSSRFSRVLMLIWHRICRYSTRTHHYISAFSSRSLSSSYAKARYRKRSSLRRKSLPLVVRRAPSSLPSSSVLWHYSLSSRLP